MSNFTEEEKEFIEANLGADESESSDESKPCRARVKSSQYTPLYRRAWVWIAVLFTIPSLASLGFLIALRRVEAFVGGPDVLRWLSEQRANPEFDRLINEIGITWLPDFLEVYEKQGIIIGAMFTVSLIVSAIIIIYKIYRSETEDERSESENE